LAKHSKDDAFGSGQARCCSELFICKCIDFLRRGKLSVVTNLFLPKGAIQNISSKEGLDCQASKKTASPP
jgi:hypothetical protein